MRRCKLGDLLRIQHGYAFKSENYVEKSEIALVTLANFSENNNFKFKLKKTTFYGATYPEEFNLNEGDLIVPLTEQVIGLFGNTAFVPKINGIKFVLNQRVGRVIVNDDVDKYFIHFLMSTKAVRDQLEARASAGTKQRNISPEDIYDVTVDVPDYTTQKEIGKFLYSIEQIINTNSQINSELQKTLQTIYEYWFLQYDYPNENNMPYKKSGGRMVYNEKLKKNIPDGWKVENLYKNSLTTIIQPGVQYFTNKNYLATKKVNETEISDGKWITFEERESRANMEPTKNSVWFAKMKNSLKHISVSNEDNWMIEKYIFSTGFLGLQCTDYSFSYLHCFINDDFFEYVKNKLSHGATQEAVNNEDLESINLLIPSEEILKKFSEITTPLIIEFNKNILNNQKLYQLLEFIIPLLLNGQITI